VELHFDVVRQVTGTAVEIKLRRVGGRICSRNFRAV
jgi:hypothetical protein